MGAVKVGYRYRLYPGGVAAQRVGAVVRLRARDVEREPGVAVFGTSSRFGVARVRAVVEASDADETRWILHVVERRVLRSHAADAQASGVRVGHAFQIDGAGLGGSLRRRAPVQEARQTSDCGIHP